MKFNILFVGLVSLLITNTNVNAYGGDSDYDYNHEKTPDTCKELFKVDKCSECQDEIWDNWKNPKPCGFNIRFIKEIIKNYIDADNLKPYDLRPYNKAVKDICGENFSCKYEDAEYSWGRIVKKCYKELHTKVDWSRNPTKIDHTVSSAYGTLLFYYFGIPNQKSTRVKKNGKFCSIEAAKKLVSWIKPKIPDGKFAISYDHKFVYSLSDGFRYKIPKDLFTCGECARKMADPYKNWPDKHPLPKYLVKNIFGSWKEVEDLYTCPRDHDKRSLDRFSRRSAENSGFSHVMASTRYLF